MTSVRTANPDQLDAPGSAVRDGPARLSLQSTNSATAAVHRAGWPRSVHVQDLTVDGQHAQAPREPDPEDLVWDEEESQALRQARKDAETTASADSVRAYLKQIGKVALLNAEQEVQLAKRIEAGLYAAERVHRAEDPTEELCPQQRRDLAWIVRDGERAKNHLLEATFASSSRWPSATPGVAWLSS